MKDINNFKLSFLLGVAFFSVSAYGKVIDINLNQPLTLNDGSDSETLITKSGSVQVETNIDELPSNLGRAITILDNPQTLINYGSIVSKVIEPFYSKGYLDVTKEKGYAIFIADGSIKNNSLMSNYGHVKFEYDIDRDTSSVNVGSGIRLEYSGNTSHMNIDENTGLISSKINVQTGDSYSSNGRAESSLITVESANALNANVNKNDGVIMADFYGESGMATSTRNSGRNTDNCSMSDVCIPVRMDRSANVVRGYVAENKGYILNNLEVGGAHAKNNKVSGYVSADVVLKSTGNAIIYDLNERLGENTGIIHTSVKATGGSAALLILPAVNFISI